jgi:HK97 gp10 family phage protein
VSFGVRVDVDAGAFQAAIPAATEEWRLAAYAAIDHVADKVVDTAQVLVAKRTTTLEHTIERGPLVIQPKGAYIQIVAGDGTRYAIYQEFGTYKMAAHPFFRPALALAGGVLRGVGYAARAVTTSKTRAAVHRAAHRQKLRQAVRAGFLTSAQARREARRVSAMRRFRG